MEINCCEKFRMRQYQSPYCLRWSSSPFCFLWKFGRLASSFVVDQYSGEGSAQYTQHATPHLFNLIIAISIDIIIIIAIVITVLINIIFILSLNMICSWAITERPCNSIDPCSEKSPRRHSLNLHSPQKPKKSSPSSASLQDHVAARSGIAHSLAIHMHVVFIRLYYTHGSPLSIGTCTMYI